MLPALQVSCLMCFVPQLIERNLYADDRFIPTEVGLPSLCSLSSWKIFDSQEIFG